MRSRNVIHVVSCHAEGEVGDVIVGGVAPPPGDTIWEQARWIAEDAGLRNFMLNEPRGGVFRHANLLVPPVDPRARAAFIVMEPMHTPPMSGSNSMCVSTVLLETGILELEEPETRFVLEAPGGLVDVTATCRDGKVERVKVQNVPSMVGQLDAALELERTGTLRVDTAYGGDTFAIVDAEALGLALVADEARDLAELGVRIAYAASEQLGFSHPGNLDWGHISFCLFAGPLSRDAEGLTTRHAVAVDPGKIDRSPTGTAVSARMAVLHERGRMDVGDALRARSILDSEFTGRIEAVTRVGDQAAIVPSVSGRAWITGTHQYLLDPDDPWPEGYRVDDTWPMPR